jgi:hypothetical protein
MHDYARSAESLLTKILFTEPLPKKQLDYYPLFFFLLLLLLVVALLQEISSSYLATHEILHELQR